MRVLIVSGEPLASRPITYGLPSSWDVRTVEALAPDLQALIDKFEKPNEIPPEEARLAVREAVRRTEEEVRDWEPDALVGIGFGGDVVAILRAQRFWKSGAVVVNPTGLYRYTPTLVRSGESVGECVWVVTGPGTRHSSSRMRSLTEKGRATSVVYANASEAIYGTGFLASCVTLASHSQAA
jgi:hypothetical protein